MFGVLGKMSKMEVSPSEEGKKDGQGVSGAALCWFFTVLTAGREPFPATGALRTERGVGVPGRELGALLLLT